MSDEPLEEINAENSELKLFTAAAISVVMDMIGDRKIDIVVIVGDRDSRELMLSGQCCPGCTAGLINTAKLVCDDMERKGIIEAEEAAQKEHPN